MGRAARRRGRGGRRRRGRRRLHDPAAWLGALAPAERERLVAFARFFAGERARAERLPVEALLERAITATGYDLAILARAGGERRLANLRKLMRLARDYEHAEGRDLRGFLAFAVTQDLAEAREGEAALESDGLDAVRLMTIHRAKGLEFPVVCVADLGRLGAGGRPRLLLGRRRRRLGLRLAPLGGGDAVPALAYDRLAAEEDRADAEEERRLLYVAMTRARERLILSGGADSERWPEPRPGGAPLDWIVRAVAGEPRELFAARDRPRPRAQLGRPRRAGALRAQRARHARRRAPARGAGARGRAAHRRARDRAARRRRRSCRRRRSARRPAPQRLSYIALQAYARCGYRFYLQRVLGPAARAAAARAARGAPAAAERRAAARPARARLARPRPARDARLRAARGARAPRRSSRWRTATASRSTPEDVEDMRALVGAFAALAAVRAARRRAPRSAARRASRSRSSRAAAGRSSTASST